MFRRRRRPARGRCHRARYDVKDRRRPSREARSSADPEREAPRVLRTLMDAGLDVYECTPVQASLEEVFLEAVG